MVPALLLTRSKDGMEIRREVRHVDGTQDALSRAYRWGLKWSAGRK